MKRVIFISFLLLLPAVIFCQHRVDLPKNRNRPDTKTEVNDQGRIVSIARSSGRQVSLTPKRLIIEWLNPRQSTIEVTGDNLRIKLIISSSEPISKDSISIYINGQKSGSKMDEVSLFSSGHEYTYENTVRVLERDQNIEVEFRNGAGTRRSAPLLIKGKAKEPMASADVLWAYWIAPNPLAAPDQPLVRQEKELPIDLMIRSKTRLSKQQVHLYLNGNKIPLTAKASLQEQDGVYRFREVVSFGEQEGMNEIYLEVRTELGYTESQGLRVNYSPLRPNLHLIAIGPRLDLDYTENDARDFAGLFARQGRAEGGLLFNTISSDVLTGQSATALNISGVIARLKTKMEARTIGENDVVMLFISSHGFVWGEDQQLRIQGNDFDRDNAKFTSISYQEDILPVLNQVSCKKVVLIDACHSAAGGAKGAATTEINRAIAALNQQKQGLTVIASSRANEESFEDQTWKNGAFTEAIIAGLQSAKADADHNQIITLNELYNYIKTAVPTMVKTVKGRSQQPVMISNGLGNLPIYVLE